MARLCFDYGHGGTDSGACYKNRKESNDVLNIGKEIAKVVRSHGVIIDEIRTSDSTVSLASRSSFSNKNSYDYFISFHRNAFIPEKASGVETYTYLNKSPKAISLANKIQSSLVNLGFKNRGVKSANFHVLRETNASAILIEIGFIDNTVDNNLFDTKRSQIVNSISKAILSQLNIKSNITSYVDKKSNTLYRVMAGSYSVRSNAEKQVQKLKSAGFDSTIIIFNK